AITVVVSAVLATGAPSVAQDATRHADGASAPVASSAPHRQRAWYDPFGWFGTDKPPAAKPSTMAWASPKGHAPPAVRTDPHAHRVRELTSRRSANASFYQLSDGRVQEVVFASPVHYRDAHGAWQPISTAVGKVAHGGFQLGDQANSFQSYFSGSPSAL